MHFPLDQHEGKQEENAARQIQVDRRENLLTAVEDTELRAEHHVTLLTEVGPPSTLAFLDPPASGSASLHLSVAGIFPE